MLASRLMCGGFWRNALPFALILLAARAGAAVVQGQSLAGALESLRGQGLEIIFSSALIEPGFIVKADPGAVGPEEVARRILEPYGLRLEPVHPGMFSVVKARPPGVSMILPVPASGDTVRRGDPPADPISIVSVYASRYAIDTRRVDPGVQFTRDELALLPGIDEDALRVTRYLPGTASNVLSARSHVRGGRESELAVYFDGAPLYEPFHFKDVQSLLGILEPQSISTVDFYSGVVPAQYGNRISGVLDIQPREWSGAHYNAIGASLLYTHALSQGRLESQPLEWLVSVRRGNIDLLGNALEREDPRPEFFDSLGRIAFDPEGPSSFALGWMLLDDGLTSNIDDERGKIAYRDSTAWLNWRRDAGEGGPGVSATLSRTQRHTWRDGILDRPGNASGMLHDRRTFDTTTGRMEVSSHLNDKLTLTAGVEGYDYDAHYDYQSEQVFDAVLAAALGRPQRISRNTRVAVDGVAYGAYLSTQIGLTPRLTLDAGARWDAQHFGSAFSEDQVSPRLSLQFQRDAATTLRLSWGRLSQTERPDELAVQDGDSSFDPAQRSEQIVASLEKRPARNVLLRIEAYRKRIKHPTPDYENLLDPFVLLPELAVDRLRIAPDHAHAYGAEFSMRWELAPTWLAWASYSRSRVRDDFGSVSVPRTWDQKNSLTAGLNWTHGAWGASANAMWHTGWRRNELLQLAGSQVELAPRNSDVWHDFLSLDARGTWRHPLPKGALQLFLEVDNIANHGNPCCTDYRTGGAPGDLSLSRDVSSWLPRIVLLGASWELP